MTTKPKPLWGLDSRETVMDTSWIEGDTQVPWFLWEGKAISHPMLSWTGLRRVEPEHYGFKRIMFRDKPVWEKDLDEHHSMVVSMLDEKMIRICLYSHGPVEFDVTVKTPIDICHFSRCG